MRRDPLETAERKGREARARGEGIEACPYRDIRNADNKVTWARSWRRAWLKGWKEQEGART